MMNLKKRMSRKETKERVDLRNPTALRAWDEFAQMTYVPHYVRP